MGKARLLERALITAGLFLAGIVLGGSGVFAVFYKLGGITVCTKDSKIEDIRVGSACLK